MEPSLVQILVIVAINSWERARASRVIDEGFVFNRSEPSVSGG